uniref:Casein kinase I n=1 Tax=Odontella aurita TaxID=265563 RepID=A0A7S4NIP7_9STRA
MAAPLSSIVPILLDEQRRRKTKVKSIPFGEVASTLVSLVEAIHNQNLIFVDIKPDNFMLAQPASKRSHTCSDACRRLRMIDFGLVENFRSRTAGGHRENAFPNGQFVGTPVYSSLNVLEGHTASRRDDIEALGYVMLELILKLLDGGGEDSDKGSPLPWSSGESDEEILEAKRKAIDGDDSRKFFSRIGHNGNKEVEKGMKQFFKVVRKMEYTEKPKYDGLKDILNGISLTVETAEDGKSTSERSTSTEVASQRYSLKRSSRRTRSRAKQEDAQANSKPPAVVVKKRKSDLVRPSETVEVHDLDSAEDSDMEDFHSCCNEDEDMDWEVESDENTPPSGDSFSGQIVGEESIQCKAGPQKRAGKGEGRIEIVFIAGPHEGESFALGGKSPEIVIVGKGPPKPRSKKSGVYQIQNDRTAAASHIKLALHSAKGGVHSVRVTDLKANAGTEVNGKAVVSGKFKQAFVGGKVQIGESVMQLKRSG